MNRKLYYWKLREAEIQLGERTLIMGVLNITPDSFSDGGRFNDPDRAYARALELEEQGADIIDIGAESTRPGSQRISADEEWQRLVPVLKRLRDNLHVPLSLDTYKSEIAERALQYGVQIFNDPSGLTFDPGLARVAANGNAGLILNHMRGQPETWGKLPPMTDPMGTVAKELEATISRARLAGVDRARIVVDPGLGFGKRKEQNSEIVAKLRKLAELDYPILLGASRKSFLSQQTEAETEFATAAAVAIAAFNGAHIVRVHDVKMMRSVLLVADEIAKANVTADVTAEEPAPAARPAVKKPRSGPYEEERVRPTRPPLSKPAVAAAPAPVQNEPEAEIAESVENQPKPQPVPPARPPFVKRPSFDKPPARVPGKFSEDRERERAKRDQGGWSAPPKREFRPGGPPPPRREYKSDGPPRREYRSDGPPPPPRREYKSDGPPRREYRSDGPPAAPRRSAGPPARGRDWRPGSGAPPKGAPPKRDFRPGGAPPRRDDRGDRPNGPPRPRGDGPPPKRPFRKRP